MAFLSELVKKPVADIDGNTVGVLKDVIAHYAGGLTHPMIEAIAVESGKETRMVPYSALGVMMPSIITLKGHMEDVPPYALDEQDIRLANDVLDKQIIDAHGARVVRVNDVEFVRVNGTMLVSNIDIGKRGILRLLGLEKPVVRLLSLARKDLPNDSISCNEVTLDPAEPSMQLRVPGEKIADLHPADVAEILSELNQLERDQFLDRMDVQQVADTLEVVEPDFQANLLKHMPDEKIAGVLEEMAPDEATDLLAQFSEERREGLLSLMGGEEAQDVRSLLSYADDTAGGVMTTAFVTVRPEMSAAEAIQCLRETGREAETIYYVYVTNAENRLLGVFSLKRLILVDPQTRVADFMIRKAIQVGPEASQEAVAQLISKYDLLAIPVVDRQGRLLGIVTADDALDQMIPTAWKKRLPRLYR